MYLILDTSRTFLRRSDTQRLFLLSVSAAGRHVSLVADPDRAMLFRTRRKINNFRLKYPHIGGRVVLLSSELKRFNQ